MGVTLFLNSKSQFQTKKNNLPNFDKLFFIYKNLLLTLLLLLLPL
jgi:hypothetical protein